MGKLVETVSDFIGGSKMTADGDCSHEIKRRLLLGRKVMTNLDSIFTLCTGSMRKEPTTACRKTERACAPVPLARLKATSIWD